MADDHRFVFPSPEHSNRARPCCPEPSSEAIDDVAGAFLGSASIAHARGRFDVRVSPTKAARRMMTYPRSGLFRVALAGVTALLVSRGWALVRGVGRLPGARPRGDLRGALDPGAAEGSLAREARAHRNRLRAGRRAGGGHRR